MTKKTAINNQKPEFSVIIGLGNPGSHYQSTYHNVGLLAINLIAQEKKDSIWKQEKLFEYQKQEKFILVKPLAFMNESGKVVSSALKKFNVSAKNLLVIQDEADIKIGEYKLSINRNSAGHKGIESIIRHLKTKSFWRLRIGVSQAKKQTHTPASKIILKKISPSDLKKIYSALEDAIEKLIGKEKP